MKPFVKKSRIVLSSYFLFLIIYACSNSTQTPEPILVNSGSIAFTVEWSGGPNESHNDFLRALDDCSGINTVEAKVYTQDDQLLNSGTWPCTDHEGTVTGIEAGENRIVVVNGLNSDENIVYRGEETGVTVTVGKTTVVDTIVAQYFAPSLLQPNDGETIPNDLITLSWESVPGAKSYYIVVSADDSFNNFDVEDTTTGTSYQVNTLSDNATYYWYVSAIDQNDNDGIGSEIWSFSTIKGGWVRLLGTIEWDESLGIAIDTNGNVYIAGQTEGDLDGNTYAGGLSDAFIAKYDPDGIKIWTELLGTSEYDECVDIAVDSSGNVFIAGSTGGDLDGNINNGIGDAFITKYNTNGNRQWTKLFGSNSYDTGEGIALDSNNNIYLTGTTSGDLGGYTQLGSGDIYIAKFSPDGDIIWIEVLGNDDQEGVVGIVVDTNGNCYIAGHTWGTYDENLNAGGIDVFIAKFNTNGDRQWVKMIGGGGDDYAGGLDVDLDGNIYITGDTDGDLFGIASAGWLDIFITKFGTNGNWLWTKLLGSTEDDYGYNIAVDSIGNSYITGSTYGDLDGILNSGFGFEDIFVAKYDISGNKLWTKLFGTNSSEEGRDIKVNSNGNIYITGNTDGYLDDITNSGSFDAFIWKLLDSSM